MNYDGRANSSVAEHWYKDLIKLSAVSFSATRFIKISHPVIKVRSLASQNSTETGRPSPVPRPSQGRPFNVYYAYCQRQILHHMYKLICSTMQGHLKPRCALQYPRDVSKGSAAKNVIVISSGHTPGKRRIRDCRCR